MFKKMAFLSVAFLLFSYMVFAVVYINPNATNKTICKEMLVEVVDTLDRHFISGNEVINALKKNNLSPEGKDISQISTAKIEEKLMENKLIKRAECYKTIDGTIKVKIFQRIPFMRVFSTKGNYYVDNEREIIPTSGVYAAYVPVASGFIDEEFAKNQLYDFVSFIQKDKFWNAQIAQIYVAQNQDIELTPTVGNHQIILGKISDYKENLDKLQLFYEKGLNKVGWNKYSVINLKYKNQVVCKQK
jgi:cell division protein FtsQ